MKLRKKKINEEWRKFLGNFILHLAEVGRKFVEFQN